MDVAFLLKGLVIGFSIAAPVGPIGLLTIRRTLAHGWGSGLATGLGAATADAAYGAIAAFGLTAVAWALVEQQALLRLVGGAFLLVLGVRTLLTRPADDATPAVASGSLAQAYGSAVLLTLTNPATILSFVAVFAGLGLGGSGADWRGAAAMVGGVFAGSALWWLLLSGATARLRHRVGARAMRAVNLAAGALLAGFGVAAVLTLLTR